MTITVIAEKPSLAKQIAAALPGPVRRSNGYMSVGPVNVTWVFGHMFQMADPATYDAKWGRPWKLDALPIVEPATGWMINPIDDSGVKAQLKVIAGLIRTSSTVVHAGDPDREGQLLIDELLHYYKWAGDTKRMLIHDTSKAGCAKAWANLKPNADYANTYSAALCRARADWLVGLNLTRAASLKIGGSTISIGRVQTPTLGLVAKRDRAIETHAETAFYTLKATATLPDATLELVHADETKRIFDKSLADGIAKDLKGQIVELQCTERELTERAPLPYTLTSYQKAAEQQYGWKGQKSLDALQLAYETGLVSYPRTGCPYLPTEQAKNALPLAQGILESGKAGQAAKDLLHLMAPSDIVYNDKKVEAHFGLVPTKCDPPEDTSPDAFKAWMLVSERFLASLLPNYRAIEKVISFAKGDRHFKIQGEEPINSDASWRIFMPKVGRDKQPIRPLATKMRGGERAKARVSNVLVSKGKTTPPKPYTESDLKEDMVGIHRYVENPAVKAVLKETTGIGTEATRTAIIEVLKSRKYIQEEKKGKKTYLRTTKLGRYVVDRMPKVLMDPVITALWEQQLDEVASGKRDADSFMADIATYVSNNVKQVSEASYSPIS